MEGLFFNIEDGFLEAIIRGYRSGIISQSGYLNLTQCETLEGNTILALLFLLF
jgi:V-type H+-transporting ATPase subunit d